MEHFFDQGGHIFFRQGFQGKFANAVGFGLFLGDESAVTRAQNDGEVGPKQQQAPGQIHPGHAGHGLVGDHQIIEVGVVLEGGEGLESVAPNRHPVAQPFEHGLRHGGQHFLVVDKEDVFVAARVPVPR